MGRHRLTQAPAGLMVAATAWCTASAGGTAPRDLAVVALILAFAVGFTVRAVDVPVRVPRSRSFWAPTAFLAWVLVDGPLRAGIDVDTLRVPLLTAFVLACVWTARQLDEAGRELVVRGLIVVGVVQAVVGLWQFARAWSIGLRTSDGLRADGMIGYPNSLAVILVATAVLTARAALGRSRPLLVAAWVAQAAGVIVTGSRLGLIIGLVIVAAYACRRMTWTVAVVVGPLVVGAVAVLVLRFLEGPEQRLQLWSAAGDRIAARPIVGHGPTLEVYTAAGNKTTTHAHNELLQLGVDYGLVGLALLGLAVAGVARRRARPFPADRWILAAAAGPLLSGLTDFGLRITAVTVVAAILTALGVAGPRTSPSCDAPRRRTCRTTTRRGTDALGRAGAGRAGPGSGDRIRYVPGTWRRGHTQTSW